MRRNDDEITEALREPSIVIVPTLFVAEIANALRNYVAAGTLTRAQAIERYEEAFELVSEVVPDRDLGVEALSEGSRLSRPAYDLIYAILARRTGSALLTCDRRLAKLAKELGIPLALDN